MKELHKKLLEVLNTLLDSIKESLDSELVEASANAYKIIAETKIDYPERFRDEKDKRPKPSRAMVG